MVSDIAFANSHGRMQVGLNPCCNGIWSQTIEEKMLDAIRGGYVLILVVMEYGLRRRYTVLQHTIPVVLILVVMEYGLRPICPLRLLLL